YTTLELLRLKSVLDGKILAMIKEIPVRDPTVLWRPTNDPNYEGRQVFESPLEKGSTKTTLKESYILEDPHPDQKRQPQVAEKTTQVDTGDYTSQNFSGAYTLKQRADLVVRYNKLYAGVIAALEA